MLSIFLAIAVLGFTIATFHENDEDTKKMKKFIIPLCVSLAVTLLFFAVVHYQWIRTSSILKERRIEIKKIELEHNKLQQQ
jgi:uncharacterized membrane protein AbrB (regulator of aidB expression)